MSDIPLNTGSNDNLSDSLHCETVIDQAYPSQEAIDDVATATCASLEQPVDFPSIADAVAPGDHVVLALEPNVPQIRDVLAGVIRAISGTEAGRVDVVLWDEASDEIIEAVTQEIGVSSKVTRHAGDRRRDVRYLAADDAADPIYVNRLLVDADMVLPIVAGRLGIDHSQHDATGIYPMLVDSASRTRYGDADALKVPAPHTAWLLGVQVFLCVIPSCDGKIHQVVTGTAAAIDRHLREATEKRAEQQADADLVVAVIDGDTQSQNWQNAARAIEAAAAVAADDATIVLWSEISAPIPSVTAEHAAELSSEADQDIDLDPDSSPDDEVLGPVPPAEDEDFPPWNISLATAMTLGKIASKHRLLIRSKLDSETVEAAGYGAIENADQLSRLSRGFSTGRVLRAAQFLAPAACSLIANMSVSEADHGDS